MTVTVDAYNVSSAALVFHNITRLRLTPDGLLPYQNITFDYTNSHYTNSLFITFFASPFALLFLIFSVYIIFITLFSYLSSAKTFSKTYPSLSLKHTKTNNFSLSSFEAEKQFCEFRRKKKKSQKCHNYCRILWIVTLGFGIVITIMGIILFLQGTLESDNILRELNDQSTESKRSIGTFSRRYLPADHNNKSSGWISRTAGRFFSRFNTYNTMKLYANETTIDASQANAAWFQQQFMLSIFFYSGTNILALIILSIFWFLLLCFTCCKIQAKSLLIYCMMALILITFMLSLSLTSGVALSDFCMKAKPVIADITVNKMPENNFTTSFVNYYLHCNLNQWNLDQHKKTLFRVFNRVDRAFASNVISGLFRNVRSGIEASFDTLHCSEINRIINDGLGEFCQKPIEAFSYLSLSYSFFFLILTLILFVITFSM